MDNKKILVLTLFIYIGIAFFFIGIGVISALESGAESFPLNGLEFIIMALVFVIFAKIYEIKMIKGNNKKGAKKENDSR